MDENDVKSLNEYYARAKRDFKELHAVYPFTKLTIYPTAKFSFIVIDGIAVSRLIIDKVQGKPKDFLGKYSKKIRLILKDKYWVNGCSVYCGDWINVDRFKIQKQHFFRKKGNLIRNEYGLKICVGTPESFAMMNNVVLESVRTADNLLVAYERAQSTNEYDKLLLKSYSHGELGKKEYLMDKHRYICR